VGCERVNLTSISFPFFILDTMNAQMTVDECKVMWVVGALQRLATLGMIGPDIPLKLTPEAVDDYVMIDNHRNILFESDFEIASIFNALAMSECDEEPEDTEAIIDLILEYKNNRTEIVKFALSHQVI
jgi:hypothetical protein